MQQAPAAVEAAFTVQPAGKRFYADHDWLKTFHSFSFADYYDPANVGWGALRVFNDDSLAPGGGFPMHPHRDMEIVTYVLSGALEHRDSMGNHGVVGAGGIQYMSAGSGVRHSEYNASKTEPLRLVQMWVHPATYGERPDYGQAEYTEADRAGTWLTVASGRASQPAKTSLRADASLHVAKLDGDTLAYAFDPSRYGFLFVAGGTLEANGRELKQGDAVRLFDIPEITVRGTGELVLWDTPAVR